MCQSPGCWSSPRGLHSAAGRLCFGGGEGHIAAWGAPRGEGLGVGVPAVPQAPDSARHRRCGAGNSRCRQRAGSCQAWLPDPCRHPGCPVPPPEQRQLPEGWEGFGKARVEGEVSKLEEQRDTDRPVPAGLLPPAGLCSAPCHTCVRGGSVQGGRAAEKTPSTAGQPPRHRGSVPSAPALRPRSPPALESSAPCRGEWAGSQGLQPEPSCWKPNPRASRRAPASCRGGGRTPSPLSSLNCGAAGGRAHPQLLAQR